MAFPDLPRTYLVKLARKNISSMFDIEALPPPHHGAMRPFKSTLAAALSVEVSAFIINLLVVTFFVFIAKEF